jgi:hypothetical protein
VWFWRGSAYQHRFSGQNAIGSHFLDKAAKYSSNLFTVANSVGGEGPECLAADVQGDLELG